MQDLELAKTLVRPNGMFFDDVAKESLLTEPRYGSVSRVYIVCEENQLMKPEFQRWIIQNSPPDEIKSIANVDHMIILSKPKEVGCDENTNRDLLREPLHSQRNAKPTIAVPHQNHLLIITIRQRGHKLHQGLQVVGDRSHLIEPSWVHPTTTQVEGGDTVARRPEQSGSLKERMTKKS
ncbi:unnamed protein product [Camellia sinensis]